VQSTILLALGLLAARIAARHSSASESAVLRAVLLATLICPAAGKILNRAGIIDGLHPLSLADVRRWPAADSIGPFVIAVAFLVGTALLVRLAVALRMVRRIRRGAMSAPLGWIEDAGRCARVFRVTPPPVLLTEYFNTPCLVGCGAPAILLPTGAPTLRSEVLIHELAHVRRRDCLWNLMARVVVALFWFQPLMWVLARRLERTADEACDDFVVAYGSNRADYAHQLVDMAERHQNSWIQPGCAVGMATLKSAVARRVVRIMDDSRGVSTFARRALTFVAIVVFSLGAGLAVALQLGDAAAAADAPAAASPRLPVPDAVTLAKAEKLVRDAFGNYSSAPLKDRSSLAAKMIQGGIDTQGNDAGRYVLLKDGMELAAGAGDAADALKAADEMSKLYAVNGNDLRLELTRKAALVVTTPASAQSVAEIGLRCADDAVAAGDYDTAMKFLAPTEAAAHHISPILASIETRAGEIRWMHQESVRAKSAEEKRAKNPDDAEANLAIGRFQCLVRMNWKQGLADLLKGSNPAFRAAAANDLSTPTHYDKQVAAGDLWWDLAEKEQNGAQLALRRRAAYWYTQAVADSTFGGLQRVLTEKRLAQAPPPEQAIAPAIAASPAQSLFLSDMKDEKHSAGHGQALFTGPTAYNGRKIAVNNIGYPHSVAIHASTGSVSWATYRLDGKYKRFTSSVGILDLAKSPPTLKFSVKADGKTLWESKPVSQGQPTQSCQIDIAGVNELQLLVWCDGDSSEGQAAWLDPQVSGDGAAGAENAVTAAGDLLSKVNLPADIVEGIWTRNTDGITNPGDGRGARIRLPDKPPVEYDMRVVFTFHGDHGMGVLLAHNDASGMWGISPKECRFRGAGDRTHMLPEKIVKIDPRLTIDAKHEATIKVRNDSISTFIDGKPMGKITEDYSQCRLEPYWSIGEHAIGLANGEGSVTFHSVEVNAVSQAPAAPVAVGEVNEKVIRTVNLLPLIDLKRDTMAGAWQLNGQGLSCDKVEGTRLGIPYDPPTEYNLHVAFTRQEGGETQIMFGKTDRRVALIFFGENPLAVGLGGMDGKPWWNNPSATKVDTRRSGVRHDVILKVRKDSLACVIDGKQVFGFKTDYSNLNEVGWWSVKPHVIGVGSNKAATIFHAIEVEELAAPSGGSIFSDTPAAAISKEMEAFAKERAALPPDQRMPATLAKLKQLNGGVEFQAVIGTDKNGGVSLNFKNKSALVNIEPLHGLSLAKLSLDNSTNLKSLNGLQGIALKELNLTRCRELTGDLSILRGMPLTSINLWDCRSLESLNGLQGMPLTYLNLGACGKLKNLAGVEGAPLKDLLLSKEFAGDGKALLQAFPTLERITTGDQKTDEKLAAEITRRKSVQPPQAGGAPKSIFDPNPAGDSPPASTAKLPLADWETIVKEPAQVAVARYDLRPLVAQDDPHAGWKTVPPMLKQYGAVIYDQRRAKRSGDVGDGAAEFEVTQTGYMLLACNWSNQGNRSGGWLSSRLQKEDFIQQGWKLIDDAVLGGTLTTNESKRDQTLFIRHVVKGEKFDLRCNKRDPPFIILLRGGHHS
jgi:beta-lactamase regulating signal transducer with metallopeptidase domain